MSVVITGKNYFFTKMGRNNKYRTKPYTHKHTCTHTSWWLVLGWVTTTTIRAYDSTIKCRHMECPQAYIIIIIIIIIEFRVDCFIFMFINVVIFMLLALPHCYLYQHVLLRVFSGKFYPVKDSALY